MNFSPQPAVSQRSPAALRSHAAARFFARFQAGGSLVHTTGVVIHPRNRSQKDLGEVAVRVRRHLSSAIIAQMQFLESRHPQAVLRSSHRNEGVLQPYSSVKQPRSEKPSQTTQSIKLMASHSVCILFLSIRHNGAMCT